MSRAQDEARARVRDLLAARGPLPLREIRSALDLSHARAWRSVAAHRWFEAVRDGTATAYRLSDEGKTAA